MDGANKEVKIKLLSERFDQGQRRWPDPLALESNEDFNPVGVLFAQLDGMRIELVYQLDQALGCSL